MTRFVVIARSEATKQSHGLDYIISQKKTFVKHLHYAKKNEKQVFLSKKSSKTPCFKAKIIFGSTRRKGEQLTLKP